MEIERIELEFDNEEINTLIKSLNDLHSNQQLDFAKLCYTIYKIDCWFADNEDEVLKSKSNDYYDKKQLFKALGFKNKQVNRYCKCYQRYMKLDDVGPKLKEPFISMTSSKLIELLPIDIKTVEEYLEKGQITPNMTVKQIREFLQTLDTEEDIEEDEQTMVTAEDKFYVLKNDTMRKDFLDNYKTWGLWFEEPRLRLKYYRCKIGDLVLVAVQHYIKVYSSDQDYEAVSFCYLNEANSLCFAYPFTYNQVFEKMKAVPDKRVYLF